MNVLAVTLVALGGALGAIFRYLVSLAARSLWGVLFPYGTLIVNTLGSFIIGFTAIYMLHVLEGTQTKNFGSFVIIGLLGAFTTFASFALETLGLMERGEVLLAFINITTNLFFCLLAVFLGQVLAKWLFY